MKNIICFIAVLSAFSLAIAEANAGSPQHYSGTSQTNGSVSKTGFVKERSDEENHMDGKAATSEDEEADRLDEKEDIAEDGGDNDNTKEEDK